MSRCKTKLTPLPLVVTVKRRKDFEIMSKHRTQKARRQLRVQRVVRPMPPGEQEISDKRDDAAQAAHDRADPDAIKYAEGVRDALAWVIGDDESPSV